MRYEGVLFDLDGTLLDTLTDIAMSANAVLARNGYATHSTDAIRRMIGWGAHDLFRRALPPDARDEINIAKIREEYIAEYRRANDANTRPYEGIPELLDELTKRGLRLAVLSNKDHTLTVKCVEGFLSNWKFDVVQGAIAGIPHKPDPTSAKQIASRMAIPPGQFLYLGDTAIDVNTAKGAGMDAVAVLWGLRDREELDAASPRYVIAHPMEAVALL